MGDLLRRPELNIADVLILAAESRETTEDFDDSNIIKQYSGKDISALDSVALSSIFEEIEISVKYSGYIKRQEAQVRQFKKLESTKLPGDIDYKKIPTLSLESREKLAATMPESLGQASRISGVTPSDIAALMVYLKTL